MSVATNSLGFDGQESFKALRVLSINQGVWG